MAPSAGPTAESAPPRAGNNVWRRPAEFFGFGGEAALLLPRWLVLRAVGAAGVAVPTVRFLLEDADDLGAGFVMDRIEGETIARRILRDDEYADARTHLTSQCGEALARIHATPLETLPALDLLGPHEQIAQYRALIDGFGAPHPTFELALRWLGGSVAGEECSREVDGATPERDRIGVRRRGAREVDDERLHLPRDAVLGEARVERRGQRGAQRRPRKGGGAAQPTSSGATGRCTLIVVPTPSSLATRMSPPIDRTMP